MWNISFVFLIVTLHLYGYYKTSLQNTSIKPHYASLSKIQNIPKTKKKSVKVSSYIEIKVNIFRIKIKDVFVTFNTMNALESASL